MQLAVADVHRDHASRASLQEDVREAAGRSADVHAVEIGRVDAEAVEAVGELLAAARHVRRRPLDLELHVLFDLLAGLVVAAHQAGKDECLGLRPRVGETALDEHDVQPLLHGLPGSRYPASPRSHSTSGSQPSTTSPKPSRRAGSSSRLNSSCWASGSPVSTRSISGSNSSVVQPSTGWWRSSHSRYLL